MSAIYDEFQAEIDAANKKLVEEMFKLGYRQLYPDNYDVWQNIKIRDILTISYHDENGELQVIRGKLYPCQTLYPIAVTQDGKVFVIYQYEVKMLRRNYNKKTDYYYVYIPCGHKRYRAKGIGSLVLETYIGPRPIVYETKMVEGSKTKTGLFRTVMICEHIDGDKSNNHRKNLRWNFIPRGERHWNHKLTNNKVLKIRTNVFEGKLPSRNNPNYNGGEKFTIPQFNEMINGGVGDNAIFDVVNGHTWRVRTEPFAPMTNPEENYNDNKK